MVHKPKWFKDGQVFVSYAPTVGINKDGADLFVVDEATGTRTEELDDQLATDVAALLAGTTTATSRWVPLPSLGARLVAVPVYFDDRPLKELDALMERPEMAGFTTATIGELWVKGWVECLRGHGSPSADLRRGDIPYIKVSDIRAGQININPTNRVSRVVAERFWKGSGSGLAPYDLITPIRTSKNIGEFAVMLPGQQEVVVTKEVLVLRATAKAPFDTFYLLWALTLRAVRRQWERVVFMQTNREDVGSRYEEIKLPVPPSLEVAEQMAKPFKDYYLGAQILREQLLEYLEADDKHYVFISTAAMVAEAEETEADEESGETNGE